MSEARPFELAVVQMDVTLGEPDQNLSRFGEFLSEAADADFVVFPECALTGYCFESEDEARQFAQTIPGPATERVAEWCREHDTLCLFGLVEKDDSTIYNALALVGPDGLLGHYRKTHRPHLGVDHFVTMGDCIQVWDTKLGKIGASICYDGAFPETARLLALQGADLIALPTNWPHGAEEFALHGINCRALENNLYYASCDRVGEERGFRFIGLSRIVDPHGKTLAEADDHSEVILRATIDPALARAKKIDRMPGRHWIDRIADRRSDLYGPLGS